MLRRGATPLAGRAFYPREPFPGGARVRAFGRPAARRPARRGLARPQTAPPQSRRGSGDDGELAPRHLGRGDGIVGERRGSAVRVQRRAVGAEEVRRPLGPRQDLLQRFDPRELLVHHAPPRCASRRAGPRGPPSRRRAAWRVPRKSVPTRRAGEQAEKRTVVASQGHALVRRPVPRRTCSARRSGGSPSVTAASRDSAKAGSWGCPGVRPGTAHEGAPAAGEVPQPSTTSDSTGSSSWTSAAPGEEEVDLLPRHPDDVVREAPARSA